jgi:hypothetical protein
MYMCLHDSYPMVSMLLNIHLITNMTNLFPLHLTVYCNNTSNYKFIITFCYIYGLCSFNSLSLFLTAKACVAIKMCSASFQQLLVLFCIAYSIPSSHIALLHDGVYTDYNAKKSSISLQSSLASNRAKSPPPPFLHPTPA